MSEHDARTKCGISVGKDGFIRTALVVDRVHPIRVIKSGDEPEQGVASIDLLDSSGHLWARLNIARYKSGEAISIDVIPDPNSVEKADGEGRICGRLPDNHSVRWTPTAGEVDSSWTHLAKEQNFLTVEVRKKK